MSQAKFYGDDLWGQLSFSAGRVYQSEYPHQVGKWIFCCIHLLGVMPRTTALCVVDDFGNLVGV